MDKASVPDVGSTDTLTTAELSVLQAICECGNADSVADQLCLSPHTVRTHLRNIREKLGVHSTMEAAVLLVKDGLPESADE